MQAAHVGDARKIARTFPESELNAARIGSMLERLTCALAGADRLHAEIPAINATANTASSLRIGNPLMGG